MILVKKVFLLFIALFFLSCSIEPAQIEYGKDACSFCKMNIVDNQHAAQLVTQKSKAFKYDAIECMMRDLKKSENKDIAIYIITDYANPGEFTDALKATYLISENIPSPMGANLSGFKSNETASRAQSEKEGTLYSWDELKALF